MHEPNAVECRYCSDCLTLDISAICMAAYPLEKKPMSIMLRLQLAQIWPSKYTKLPFWSLKTETGTKGPLAWIYQFALFDYIVFVINSSAVCLQVCVR